MGMQESTQKFCKDCKWNKPCRVLFIRYPELDRCTNLLSWWTNDSEKRRKKVVVDPVTGKVKKPDAPWIAACRMERNCHEGCGPSGRYFEAKE